MGLIIIIMIVATVGVLAVVIKEGGLKDADVGDVGCGFLMFVIGSLLAVLISIIVSLSVVPFLDKTIVVVGETPLVAIKDGSSVSGSFFLGCGTIGESQKYTYLKEITSHTGRKAFKSGSVHVASAIVIETNEESPKMIRYEYILSSAFAQWLLFCGPSTYKRVPIEFIIPVGSVITTYEVDLE